MDILSQIVNMIPDLSSKQHYGYSINKDGLIMTKYFVDAEFKTTSQYITFALA